MSTPLYGGYQGVVVTCCSLSVTHFAWSVFTVCSACSGIILLLSVTREGMLLKFLCWPLVKPDRGVLILNWSSPMPWSQCRSSSTGPSVIPPQLVPVPFLVNWPQGHGSSAIPFQIHSPSAMVPVPFLLNWSQCHGPSAIPLNWLTPSTPYLLPLQSMR